MPNDGRKDSISLRPTPGYKPRGRSGYAPADRLQPWARADISSSRSLSPAPAGQPLSCLHPQRIPTLQTPFTMQPQGLQCFDGFYTVLNGEQNALLTGSGSGCTEVLSALLLHALSDNGSVLFLTGDRGETRGCSAAVRQVCVRYGLPLRHVGDGRSGRFLPFANWTQQQMYGYFSQKIAGEYMSHDAAPDADMLGCMVDLFELLEADHSFGESLADPRFDYQMALDHCEMADMPEANRRKLYNHMLNHTETLIKAQGILREFITAFGPEDRARGGEAYSIFSPGVNRVIVDAQNAMIRGSQPWFLLQMAGYINSLAGSHHKITLLLDGLTPDTLRNILSLMHNSSIRTITVAGSLMELGDQAIYAPILSRSDLVFIFRQQDRNAAEFWSALSGERKVLLRNYSSGQSTSKQPWQFDTRGTSSSSGYSETFRPRIQAGEFAALSDRKAYLYMAGDASAEAFHPFFLD